MNITYPIICQKKDGRYFIDFYINTKRYRLFTAQKILYPLIPLIHRMKILLTIMKMVLDLMKLNKDGNKIFGSTLKTKI